MHYAQSILDENQKVNPLKLKPLGRLGGAWYSKTTTESLFEFGANPAQPSVGYDLIPFYVRQSKILTAAELSMLAWEKSIPDETEVNDFKLEELSEYFLELQDEPEALQDALINKAKEFLSARDYQKAWSTVLSFNP